MAYIYVYILNNMGIFMTYVIPVNYRTHAFHLCGVDLNIGAMAAPDKRNPDVDGALTYLVEHEHMNVLIGLKEESFATEAEAKGLEYIHLPIVDFSVPPPAKYDAIYATIKTAIAEGKNITIHCGAGNGRSGVALASLKLRELIEKAVETDPLILDENPPLSASVSVSMEGGVVQIEPCTPFVKIAIEQLRTNRSAPNNTQNGSHSVETGKDIQALLAYERHIKRGLKQERGLPLDVIEPAAISEIRSSIVPIDSKTETLLQEKTEKAIQQLKNTSFAPPPPPAKKKGKPFVPNFFKPTSLPETPFASDPFSKDPFANVPFSNDLSEKAPISNDLSANDIILDAHFPDDPFATDPFVETKNGVKEAKADTTEEQSDNNDVRAPSK